MILIQSGQGEGIAYVAGPEGLYAARKRCHIANIPELNCHK